MAGDDKPRTFLWSDASGNAASALLLLVAGWILGQLKWDHMLMTGVAIAALLTVFLACRYFYARRHPESHPLTIAELRAELGEARMTVSKAADRAVSQPVAARSEESEVTEKDDVVQFKLRLRSEDFSPAGGDFHLWLEGPSEEAEGELYQVTVPWDFFEEDISVGRPPTRSRTPRWQALRQMVGLR